MASESDIRASFDGAVESYDQARPSYPAELFHQLFDLLPAQPHIIEVGPGTGKATKDLLARDAHVHAVEIGPAMAAKLRSNLPSDRLRITNGAFELVPIAPGSADAVFAATAYHWISPAAQVDRPAEILHKGGIVAIVDLIQVESPDDAGFFAASQPIYERYGQGHNGPPSPTRAEARPEIFDVFNADRRFGAVTVHRYDWNQTYDASQYRQLMLSYSATQMMDEPDRRGLLEDMEAFITTHFDGVVTRPLVATLTTAILT
ncbi:MAG: class I SAM-dependent methyltransferase [Acidimicrobiales bacterium]